MSVNQSYAIDQSKTAKFGKLFHTIDFERLQSYSAEDYRTRDKTAPAGNFMIDNKNFPVTIHELERIKETVTAALSTLGKSYNLNLI